MSSHDRIRQDRALACDRNDIDSVADALRGLQSTDDPSLNNLHDELMEVYNKLQKRRDRVMAKRKSPMFMRGQRAKRQKADESILPNPDLGEQRDRDDCKRAFAEWQKTPTYGNMSQVIPEQSLNLAFYWGFMAARKNPVVHAAGAGG